MFRQPNIRKSSLVILWSENYYSYCSARLWYAMVSSRDHLVWSGYQTVCPASNRKRQPEHRESSRGIHLVRGTKRKEFTFTSYSRTYSLLYRQEASRQTWSEWKQTILDGFWISYSHQLPHGNSKQPAGTNTKKWQELVTVQSDSASLNLPATLHKRQITEHSWRLEEVWH